MYNLQITEEIKWDEEKQREKSSKKIDKIRQIESTKLVAELNPNT